MSIGLDIGSYSIKMVEIQKEGNAPRLKAAGMVGYQGISPDAAKTDQELLPLADAIKKLHKQINTSSKEVNISLPEAKVFTRMVKFPLLSDQELASAIKWEAEQYIPIPVSEAIIQYQIIERKETATPPGVKFLLVAAPRALVEKYVKVVQMAGLTVVGVETELLSLVRALAPAEKTALLLDFGASSSDIAISAKKQLVFSRSIPTAGKALTRALAQGLGMSPVQAEEYKKTYGLAKKELEGKVKQVLDPVVRLIADEIKKAIYFYESEEKGESPSLIIVSGGTSAMPYLIPTLTEILGMEVILGNPLASLVLDPVTKKNLENLGSLYSVAFGLALREAD